MSVALVDTSAEVLWKPVEKKALLGGEILITTKAYTAWGGAVEAAMFLPLSLTESWQKITDYPRWQQYFFDLTDSRILEVNEHRKRLYQVARKTFLFLSVQVEIYLRVLEIHERKIDFVFERGNFNDFSATLNLHKITEGTILTYAVQATPTIPVPSLFIQQAMNLDLPNNMRQMRRVMCEN